MGMMSRPEEQEIRVAMVELAAHLDSDLAVDDAWAIEQVALTALPVLLHPDTPPPLAQMLTDAFVARRDEVAAGALTALARLAHPPLRDHARAARAELARDGIVSPHDEAIGALRVIESAVLEFEGQTAALACLLQRPASPDSAQTVVAFFAPEDGALMGAELGDEEPTSAARQRFRRNPLDAVARAVTDEEALVLFERAIRIGEPIRDAELFDLAILERALTGADMHLPRPEIFPADDLEIEDDDPGPAGRLVDQMIAEGIDPSDPIALANWLEDFNARPFAERRELTDGPAASSKAKQKRRRAAKAARRRNRRR